jgi:hypothetical protein
VEEGVQLSPHAPKAKKLRDSVYRHLCFDSGTDYTIRMKLNYTELFSAKNTECFKKNFKRLFQMLLCSNFYENIYT